MDPNNQYPGSPQGNPYDFILNPSQTPKKSMLGGNGLLKTVLIILGVFILVAIIMAVVVNLLAPKKVSTADLTGIAQTQTELIRISTQGATSAVQQSTKNLATTVEYTMMTQQTQTLDVLGKNGVKLGSKELALKQNATTDQKFASAKATSTFDQTFTDIIESNLTSYANTLKQLSTISSSKTERDRMSNYYQQTQLLLSQVPYTQNNIDSAGTTQANQ
jgi:hypothetical protein